MQFHKKTSRGKYNFLIKILAIVSSLTMFFYLVIVLVDKIDFPAPNKQIEKNISNENFKVVK